jgi:hypothetical protein
MKKLARVILIFAVLLSAAGFAKAADRPVRERPSLDWFGLGFDMAQSCDFSKGAAISDKCFGFFAGIVELIQLDQLQTLTDRTRLRTYPKICLPPRVTVFQIVEATRHKLSLLFCAGLCPQSGFVLDALEAAYPCKQ